MGWIKAGMRQRRRRVGESTRILPVRSSLESAWMWGGRRDIVERWPRALSRIMIAQALVIWWRVVNWGPRIHLCRIDKMDDG
jgi:hypothetical protein